MILALVVGLWAVVVALGVWFDDIGLYHDAGDNSDVR